MGKPDKDSITCKQGPLLHAHCELTSCTDSLYAPMAMAASKGFGTLPGGPQGQGLIASKSRAVENPTKPEDLASTPTTNVIQTKRRKKPCRLPPTASFELFVVFFKFFLDVSSEIFIISCPWAGDFSKQQPDFLRTQLSGVRVGPRFRRALLGAGGEVKEA